MYHLYMRNFFVLLLRYLYSILVFESIKDSKILAHYQFIRIGYFYTDNTYSKHNHLAFNRSTALKK